MPPPPSPLAHRRTKPSVTSTDSSSCVPRKMSLSKGATFHQPSSPSTEDDPVISVAHLSKPSTTCTSSSFASWLYSGRETAADVIADFEQTFSGARGPRSATRRRSAREFEDNLLAKAQHRASSPVDSGIGSSIGSPSEKNLSRTLEKALDLTSNKDSAIGASVEGSVAGSEQLIQGWLHRCVLICSSYIDSFSTDTNATKAKRATRSSGAGPAPLTIIRYPIPSPKKDSQPALGQFARRQIYKRLFAPLLQEARFEEFRPIVAGTRKNKSLRCLRDIEQSLINQPVVSTIYPLLKARSDKPRKTLTVTPSQYRSFGELTIQLVIDTYQHLSEVEQRRPVDRAYDNGYFLDLVQQVQQLAAHIGSSNTAVEDGNEPSADDEVTLEGGLAESGNLAELVRWKNGEGISLRTGLPYVPMAGMKRTASNMDGPNADLSMARRKKGVEYPVLHMPCSEPGCDKVFHRKCDLSKHEKTHSRPYKCGYPNCKYNDFGLPTEKELDRHMNDKHNQAPKMYHCKFCEFQTKRESNCKQHMEKKHNWTYQRSKGKDKATELTPAATPQTQGLGYTSVQPSPMNNGMPWDAQSPMSNSVNESPYEQPLNDFGNPQEYQYPLFPRRPTMPMVDNNYNGNEQLCLDTSLGNGFNVAAYPTPASGVLHNFTPRTPAYSNITPSPSMMSNHNVYTDQYGNAQFPTPESEHSNHSRHASIAQETVMQPNMFDPNTSMDMDMSFENLPLDDFTMFGAGQSNPAFTHNGAGDLTLFPSMANAETAYTAGAFEAIEDMDFDNTNFNDLVHFDA